MTSCISAQDGEFYVPPGKHLLAGGGLSLGSIPAAAATKMPDALFSLPVHSRAIACSWQVAVVCQMIEALNPAYDTSVYDWEVSNKQGPKPR